MPTHKTTRRRVQPIVAAVVQPVARRLARIEALLIEMRFELDAQGKRYNAIVTRIDALSERISRKK